MRRIRTKMRHGQCCSPTYGRFMLNINRLLGYTVTLRYMLHLIYLEAEIKWRINYKKFKILTSILLWPGILAVSAFEISILLQSSPTSVPQNWESCKSKRQQNKELSRQHVQSGLGKVQISNCFQSQNPRLLSLILPKLLFHY